MIQGKFSDKVHAIHNFRNLRFENHYDFRNQRVKVKKPLKIRFFITTFIFLGYISAN